MGRPKGSLSFTNRRAPSFGRHTFDDVDQRETKAQAQALLRNAPRKLTQLETRFLDRMVSQTMVSQRHADMILDIFNDVALRGTRWELGLALYRKVNHA